jgi:predicted permease
MVICYSSPTALQLFMICNTHKNQAENVTKVLLFMYLISPLPMALFAFTTLLAFY